MKLIDKIIAVAVVLVFIIALVVSINNLKEKNMRLMELNEALKSNMDTIKTQNATLTVTKKEFEQSLKSNDSLRSVINELKIRKPERIETVTMVTEVRDSIVFRDNIVTRPIDTVLANPNYTIALKVTQLNAIGLDIDVPTDLYIVQHTKKVHQDGFLWWFKKRIKVQENSAKATNPCVTINNIKVIEVK